MTSCHYKVPFRTANLEDLYRKRAQYKIHIFTEMHKILCDTMQKKQTKKTNHALKPLITHSVLTKYITIFVF